MFLHPPFARDMYPVSVYFGMFIQFLTTIFYSNGFDQTAEGVDEGSDHPIYFFLWKDKHWGKSLLYCHYTSHEHPMHITCVFCRCSRCPLGVRWFRTSTISDWWFRTPIGDFGTVILDGVRWNRTMISDVSNVNFGRWYQTMILDGVMFTKP